MDIPKKDPEKSAIESLPFRGGPRWHLAWGLPFHPQCADGPRRRRDHPQGMMVGGVLCGNPIKGMVISWKFRIPRWMIWEFVDRVDRVVFLGILCTL